MLVLDDESTYMSHNINMSKNILKKDENIKFKRKMSLKPISDIIHPITNKAFKKKGFLQGEIISKWSQIVGEDLAKKTQPKRIRFASHSSSAITTKLIIQVAIGYAPIIQHQQKEILDKVNTYFGYLAIGKLQLIQAPLMIENETIKVTKVNLTKKERQRLDNSIKNIQSYDLSEALKDLGKQLINDKKKKVTK